MKGIVIIILAISWMFHPAVFPADINSIIIKHLEFRELDIKDVLRQLARQYNLNIVFSEAVKGDVTVELNNISLSEALDAIITINGFSYVRKDNVIKVTTAKEAQEEGVMTKLFKLNNADAVSLQTALKKVLTSEGTIEADNRSNSLIVTDTPSVIDKIERMLPDLDRVIPQVLIESRFIEASLGTTESLGINWNVAASASGAGRPTTVPFRPKGGEKWAKNIFPPIDPSSATAPSSYAFPYTAGDIASSAADITQGDFLFGTLDFSQLSAVLNFLKTKTDAKLISSPRVVAMDNKRAQIYIGKTRPVPTFEYNDTSGRYDITGFDEKIEGVTLTVTPSISKTKDGYDIKLKLTPKVSSYVDKVTFTSLGFDYPVLSERSVDTEVTVKDGQTIVIGGLITSQKTESVHKLPLFGDLPLVGNIFSHKEIDPNSRSELMIFVTARVLKNVDKPLTGYGSNLITAPLKPFKMSLRKIKVGVQ